MKRKIVQLCPRAGGDLIALADDGSTWIEGHYGWTVWRNDLPDTENTPATPPAPVLRPWPPKGFSKAWGIEDRKGVILVIQLVTERDATEAYFYQNARIILAESARAALSIHRETEGEPVTSTFETSDGKKMLCAYSSILF